MPGLEYDDGTNGVNRLIILLNYRIPITGTGDFGGQPCPPSGCGPNFSAQNMELNVLRLPLCCGGLTPAAAIAFAPAFNLVGLCGVRYLRVDDDFEFGTEWAMSATRPMVGTSNSPNELFHDIRREHLVGFQLART